MNTRERFVRTLTGQDVDRVPFMKIFGGDNAILSSWLADHPEINGKIDEILGFEGGYRGWRITPVNFWLSSVPAGKVVSEDDKYIIYRNGDGSLVQSSKSGDFHNQTLEYPVKDANDWDRIKSQYLNPYDKSRIPDNWRDYVELYKNRDFPLQLTCGGVYGFARNMMGDEALCYAFYDEPELVHDIINTYISMTLKIWEILCKDVQFDLAECWEDMASKTGCIISPSTFREFLSPHYRRIKSFLDAHNIPILLVDSDGNIDDLSEVMYECGVNAMYPFEVGAGCNVIEVLDKLPKMGALGCLEKNSCALGKDAIEEQMEIARNLIRHGRCIPGPDHFVLSNVSYEGYKYFMTRLREVIMTTPVGC